MEARTKSVISVRPFGHGLLWSLLLFSLFSAAGCRALEHRIIYNPYRYPKAWVDPLPCELSGLDFEDVCFESLDGTQLHGWLVKPTNSTFKKTILFAHGRTGNVSTHKQKLLEFVRRQQAAVFIFDYRGFGKSAGVPSENGLYQDVQAARDWLARRAGIDSSEIILYGRSLGAATVIDLAVREGGKAMIIESSFTSAPDLLIHHSHGTLHGPRMDNCFNSKTKIGKFTGPVFISHGRKDKAVPFSHGVRLAHAATSSSRVEFHEFLGGHSDPPGEGYESALGAFLDSVSTTASPSETGYPNDGHASAE